MALRVSERVTMMHNGRVLKEGTPEEIENDPEVQEIYLGGGHALSRRQSESSASATCTSITANRTRSRAST